MGQYWKLINLDKHQTFGHWGKLGEFIPSSRPSQLVPYLTIPLSELPDTVENVHLVGSWAGDRIICVGDYLYHRDRPLGLFTEDEIRDAGVNSMYKMAEEYATVTPVQLPPLADVFGHDRVWVLRNLSKREYVRIDGVGTALDKIFGPVVARGYPGLGPAVLSRICWSSDSSGSKHLCRGITRGVWAGDRFDIQPIDTVEDGDDWKDVTDQVAEDVRLNYR
jgi:hypothetical protein